MKKLFILLVLGVLFLACEREELPLETEGEGPDVNGNIQSEQTRGNAVVCVYTAYFEKLEDEDGNISYKELGALGQGETVLLLDGEIDYVMIGADRLYLAPTHVNDEDVFINVWYLLPKQRLGVVIADTEAEVFDGLDPMNITTDTVPRGTVIGIAPLESKDNPLSRQRFVASYVLQPSEEYHYFGTWAEFYLDSSVISTKQSDLKMAEVLANLHKKDKSLWGKILDDAEKIYADSNFIRDAEEMRDQAITSTYASQRETESFTWSGELNDDQVNVRTDPDETLNNVVGQLNYADVVSIIEKTVQQYTIGDYTDYWYKIEKDDIEGWIFGQFIMLYR